MDKMPHLEPTTGWVRTNGLSQPVQPHPVALRPVIAPLPSCGIDVNPIWDSVAEIPARVWLNTLLKRVARVVRAPNSAKTGVAGNQHPSFSIDMSPYDLTERKCLEAGLKRQQDTRVAGNLVRTWRGDGPYMAYQFCRTNLRKPFGQGSGVLAAPRRNRPHSSVLTIAIPPITVKHIEGEDDLEMTVDFYLAVFLDTGALILPSNSNRLYKPTSNPTQLFTGMAMHILGEMATRDFPLSSKFHEMLGSEYNSAESELSSEGEEGEEGEEGKEEELPPPPPPTSAEAMAARTHRREERKRKLASA